MVPSFRKYRTNFLRLRGGTGVDVYCIIAASLLGAGHVCDDAL
jgi:hypothetical protein